MQSHVKDPTSKLFLHSGRKQNARKLKLQKSPEFRGVLTVLKDRQSSSWLCRSPFKWSGGRGFTNPYFNFTLALICIVLIISLTNFNSLWTISTKSSSAEKFSWSQQIHNHHPKLCHILTSKQIKIVYISIMDFGKNKTHNIICNLLILSLLILQHLTLLQHPH